MAYAPWPNTLPLPLVAGYGEALSLALLRVPVDKGTPLQRAITDALPLPIDATVVMTRAEYAIFKAFVLTTLGGGSLPFEWTDPLTQTTRALRFRDSPTLRAEAPEILLVGLPLELLPA